MNLLLPLLNFYHGNRDQPMGFPMRINDGGGIRRLRQTEDGSVFLIHPIIDKIYTVFVFDGEVFLVSGSNGGCSNIAGSQLVDIEVEVVVPFHRGFLTLGYLENVIRE